VSRNPTSRDKSDLKPFRRWEPNGEEEGVSVFIQGYENRGPNNERKRIYASATTPDLVATKYRGKLIRFFQELFADASACVRATRQPLKEWVDSRVQAIIDGQVAERRSNVCPLLAEERRTGRALPKEGHRL
jgi:hypothetical protein